MNAPKTITFRDGQRLSLAMAYWFDLMARDFLKDTGCTLHISSGLRYSWEQENIFRDRYVPSSEVAGRRVYDFRWWNGVLWARISPAGTVAVPRTSNHEFEVTGVGAIDVYDSGSDPGVATRGTARSNWMERNARKYHYDNEGMAFGEAWHKRFLGGLWSGIPGMASLPDERPRPTTPPKQEEEEIMSAGFAYVKGGSDKERRGCMFDTTSGFQADVTWFAEADATAFAQGMGAPRPLGLSGGANGAYDKFVAALAEVRARNAS